VPKLKIPAPGLPKLWVLPMKTRKDPRHKTRVEAVKLLFEKSFGTQKEAAKGSLTQKVLAKKRAIDAKIKKYAPAWPIEQIAPVDLAVLRLAIYELLYKEPKEPYKVIIDEAVEIAKEYGSGASGSFVNGVLGTIMKSNGRLQ